MVDRWVGEWVEIWMDELGGRRMGGWMSGCALTDMPLAQHGVREMSANMRRKCLTRTTSNCRQQLY